MTDIDDLEERLRAVENAIIEIRTMTSMMRLVVGILALSLGIDVTGVV